MQIYLEKWYADTLDEQNADHPSIRYAAHLTLWGLKFSYAAVLGTERSARFRFGHHLIKLPKIVNQQVVWQSNIESETLSWSGAKPCSLLLWQDKAQYVRWTPWVLNGACERTKMEGLPAAQPEQALMNSKSKGYVEQLVLNIAPWKLGLQKLKWGRFCGPKHSLVWIEWEGKLPLKVALLDGASAELQAASQTQILLANAQLNLFDIKSLVSESLKAGALQGAGLIGYLIPRRFLLGEESKWVAKASLSLANGATEVGQVIYEEVTWAK